MLCVTTPVLADICLPVSKVLVDGISFKQVSVEKAIERLFEKTTYRMVYSAKGVKARVSADHVSGDLDSVLTALAEQAGVTWEQEDCRILIASTPTASPDIAVASPVAAVPVVTLWAVSPADKNVRRAITRWGKQAGYEVIWDVNKDITIEANATFAGSFEDATRSILESIADSEYPVEALLYENNVVRISKMTHKQSATGVEK